MSNNHYTFGENDLAAQRLAHLAAAYEQPTRAFLTTWGSKGVGHVIDLGCGPGHTSLLLHAVLEPHLVTGVDASEPLLAQARARAPHLAFVRHDVTQAPFPCAQADLLFCRFLLTHLRDPAAAVRAWSSAARPGARLLIQETAGLQSDDPIIARYYDLVAALQSGYGQSLNIGAAMDRHVVGQGWAILSNQPVVVEQEARTMARLHAMNIRTWSQDGMARRLFDPDEIAAVQCGLDEIASGQRSAPPVLNTFGQVVAVRS